MATEPDETAPTASAIAGAIDKNKKAAEAVKEAADDLLIVHAVLNEEIAEEARTAPVDQAVEQTGEIEKRLSKSADLLDEVNASLEGELKKPEASS
jgi:hypothetical protein